MTDVKSVKIIAKPLIVAPILSGCFILKELSVKVKHMYFLILITIVLYQCKGLMNVMVLNLYNALENGPWQASLNNSSILYHKI